MSKRFTKLIGNFGHDRNIVQFIQCNPHELRVQVIGSDIHVWHGITNNMALKQSIDSMGVTHVNRPSAIGSIGSLRRLILMNCQQPPDLDRESGLLQNFTMGGLSQRLARFMSTTRKQIRSFIVLLVLQK